MINQVVYGNGFVTTHKAMDDLRNVAIALRMAYIAKKARQAQTRDTARLLCHIPENR